MFGLKRIRPNVVTASCRQLLNRGTCASASTSRRALPQSVEASRSFSTLPPSLLTLPETKITTLDNGLRVATEEGFGATATVGVWIDAGSACESEADNGVAHFLEHMAFKGTARRSRSDIEEEVENQGSQLNAYTSREQTVFFAQCLNDKVENAVDILSDILQHSKLDPALIEEEKSVILQEKEFVEGQVEEVMFDYLHAAAFQGHALGRTILGPNRNIKSINKDSLERYIKENYRPHRMVIAGAGAVNHDQLVGMVKEKFSALPASTKAEALSRAAAGHGDVPPYTGSEIRLYDESMPTAHIAFAFESVGWASKDYYTFLVMQAIVGSWTRAHGAGNNVSSRLGELVATEGLAHSVQPFNTCYNDTGLFGVYVVGENDHLDSLAYETLQELVRIANNVTDAEVERAKNQVKAGLLLALDGSSAVAEEIGRQMISLGRRISPAEMFMRVDQITPQDVMRVATHHCTDVDVCVAAVGPLGNFPEYNQLRSWTYYNRV